VVSDFELLEAWRKSDKRAGGELFERHFASVLAFFRNKVGDEAPDLVQRTFLSCVKARDRFEGRSSFRTYLFTVARNELYDHLRRRKRDAQRFDALEVSVESLGPSPATMAVQKRERRLLLEGLRRIPVDHQVILELYFWEELSAREIGEVVGAPEGTVRTRIRRAKQLLEAELSSLANDPQVLSSTIANLEDWARSLRVAAYASES
jgi:RNA polymerase sigma-70 factor (ECF subfamily)